MKKVLAFLTLILPFVPAQAQEIPVAGLPPIVQDQSKLPHVVILSMGGTIAARAKDRMNLTHYGDGPAVGISCACAGTKGNMRVRKARTIFMPIS